jgi:hypothetical protein
LAPPGGDVPYAVDVPKSELTLAIGLSHRRFYAVEPVELDVTIALAENAKTNRHDIPAEVDFGYSRLKLWLTLPNGEKRLYRSAVHHCPTGDKIRVSRKKPFHRDISVFWSTDGFTFGQPGKYAIQASYELSRECVLRSNKVTCEVIASSEERPSFSAVLWRQDAVDLLHLKDAIPAAELEGKLAACASAAPGTPTSALIHYALGRARAKTLAAGNTISEEQRELGKSHLAAALRSEGLGSARRRKAKESLKALSV